MTRTAQFGHWLRRWWPWIAVVFVALALVGRSQQQAEKLSDTVQDVQALSVENRALTTSLQAAIVDACKENGNASRKTDRETLREEIREAKHPDPAVLRAFKSIPPAKLVELINKQVARLEVRLARVAPVKCAQQYQISPGAGARRRSRLEQAP